MIRWCIFNASEDCWKLILVAWIWAINSGVAYQRMLTCWHQILDERKIGCIVNVKKKNKFWYWAWVKFAFLWKNYAKKTDKVPMFSWSTYQVTLRLLHASLSISFLFNSYQKMRSNIQIYWFWNRFRLTPTNWSPNKTVEWENSDFFKRMKICMFPNC